MIDVAHSLQVALTGRYEIQRELGHGGMARVYLAADLKHGREVALKVLRPELAAAVGAERFLREIRVEGALQHPQILPMFDSGEADGLLYYVMPYVPGESLRGRLQREKQLRVDDALHITLEVADALDYAHRQGVVHRDVKPENILLSQGHAVVADFGIARAVSAPGGDRLTATGTAVGTPAYMSPEQGSGSEDVDCRSDVYSLGCVLFEMLAGEPPFTGRTAQVIIARHMHDRPPSLQVIRPALPSQVVETVEIALAKVPADRFASAADFARALTSPTPRRQARRRALAGLRSWAREIAIGVILAGLALGIWGLIAVRRAPALDPNRVVVFPFRDAAGGSGQLGIGEDVATYIGHLLDGSEPLKWEEASAGGADVVSGYSTGSSHRSTLEFARGRGSAFYIDGAILRSKDSVTVVARLYDVSGDSLVRRAGRSGPVGASEARLGAMAVVDLLPILLEPGRKVDVGTLADRHPAAIANFLQGERTYRRTQFLQALEHYHRALQDDSAIALAAVKGAQAASWLERHDEAERLVTLALRDEARLPSKYRSLSRGLRDYMMGAADSAVGQLRRAIAIAPDWSEAWMALGEVYYHLLPRETPLDSLAEDAFRRALRSDSAFSPPLYHLAEISLRRGDVSGADRLTARLRRVDPDSTLALGLDLMLGCVRGRLGPADWARRARRSYPEVLDAAHALATSPDQAECAKAGFRAILASDSADDSRRFGALFGLQNLLVRERRFDEARGLLKSELGRKYGGDFFFLLDAATVGGFDQEADDVARAQGDEYGAMTTRRLWILGLWASKRGRAGAARQIAVVLEAKADSTRDRRDRLFAEIMAAHAALVGGDSALALRLFQALTPTARSNEIAWSLWEPLGPERLALAELLLAQGKPEFALAVASAFDSPGPIAYVLYLPASLAVRARAADAMHDAEAASRYNARLAALTRRDVGRSSVRVKP